AVLCGNESIRGVEGAKFAREVALLQEAAKAGSFPKLVEAGGKLGIQGAERMTAEALAQAAQSTTKSMELEKEASILSQVGKHGEAAKKLVEAAELAKGSALGTH